MSSRPWRAFCRRRSDERSGGDGDVANVEPGYDLARVAGDVRVTLTSMAGERLELQLPARSPLADFKAAVKSHKGAPIAAQRFVLPGGALLEASDAAPLGPALGVPQGGSVELSYVRGALPEDAQRAVDRDLMRAAAQRDATAMEAALGDGARADHEVGAADRGISPLMVAIAAGDGRCASLLRAAGAEEPPMQAMHAATLGQAFARRRLDEVVRLLAAGASANTRLNRGQGVQDTSFGTPLHACCALHNEPGAVPTAELLLTLGANPCSPDGEGDSPLAHAKYFDAPELYGVLQQRGGRMVGPYYSLAHITGRRIFGWQ